MCLFFGIEMSILTVVVGFSQVHALKHEVFISSFSSATINKQI